MVIELLAGETWAYTCPAGGQAQIAFASASSPDDARLEVRLNGELVECVYLRVPHSWWNGVWATGRALENSDRIDITAVGGKLAMRLDLDAQTTKWSASEPVRA
jgi:hypothetical protein